MTEERIYTGREMDLQLDFAEKRAHEHGLRDALAAVSRTVGGHTEGEDARMYKLGANAGIRACKAAIERLLAEAKGGSGEDCTG